MRTLFSNNPTLYSFYLYEAKIQVQYLPIDWHQHYLCQHLSKQINLNEQYPMIYWRFQEIENSNIRYGNINRQIIR